MSEPSLYQEDDSSRVAGEFFSGKLTIEEALTKLRGRLLDLSLRNRLLNYRHPKGRSFQFTGSPDLDVVFDKLEDGRPIPLLYVPDPPPERYEEGKRPDVRVFAREVGIGTAIEIESPSSTATQRSVPGLQVLRYPADLERACRKISTEARTVVEETGTNMLYLVFGFLEYFDSEDSDKAVHAPLLSMPVTLDKGALDGESRTYRYELSNSGEDITENFTLREKLRQQFRLELPELAEDDTPTTYLAKIEKAISKRRNWRTRRQLTLGFLSFGKLAIWADLDPANAEGMLSSDLLRMVFSGGEATPVDAFHAEDYDIDSHEDAELPLIYDADSSQHSALIDVKNGKNLVINGPPGTGKSQTITNIIATAIADGKKVLFVSEKLAALEVVKNRLEGAHLGDFCLELHSHKTQKKQLLANIKQRIEQRYSVPRRHAARVEVLREHRDKLNTYAQLLGSRAGNSLEMTVHDVFWTTERKRQALGEFVEAVSGLSIQGAQEVRAEQLERHRMNLRDASEALLSLGSPPMTFPWVGFSPELLIKGDEVPIMRVMDAALAHLQALQSQVDILVVVLETPKWTISELEGALASLSALESVDAGIEGDLLASMFASGLSSLERVALATQRLRATLATVRDLQAHAESKLRQTDGISADVRLSQIGFAQQSILASALATSVDRFGVLARNLAESLAAAQDVSYGRATLVPRDPHDVAQRLQHSLQKCAVPALMSMPASDLGERSEKGLQVLREVTGALDQVNRVFADCGLQFSGRADEVQALLDEGRPHDLLPDIADPGMALKAFQQYASQGWQDWTAGQFSAEAREMVELLAAAL